MDATAYGIMANQAVVQDIGIHPSGANQEKTISDNELELRLTSREEVDPANLAFRAEALLQMKLSDEEIRDLPVLLDSEAGGVPGDYVDEQFTRRYLKSAILPTPRRTFVTVANGQRLQIIEQVSLPVRISTDKGKTFCKPVRLTFQLLPAKLQRTDPEDANLIIGLCSIAEHFPDHMG